MRTPAEVATLLDALLDVPRFRETEPENGLLVDADRPVRRLGAAVNTTFRAIDAAAESGVEMLLVHHPSWPHIDLRLHDRKLARLRELGVSLYGAHASLDAAPGFGTGDALARLLGIQVDGRFADYEGGLAGVHGRRGGDFDDLVVIVRASVGPCETVRSHERAERIGIVTGAGSYTSWLQEAQDLGCDTYLTGEGSMYTRLFAREVGLNLVLAGHYRTEAPGIAALAELAAGRLELDWVVVDDEAIG